VNVLTLSCLFAGFGALCLSMARHARQALGSVPGLAVRAIAAVLGWALLALSLLPSLKVHGVSIGIAAWLGFSTLAAVAVGLLLAYKPRVFPRFVFGAVILSLVGTCLF
jgi:hypothetical protein